MWFLFNGTNDLIGRYKTKRGLNIAIGKLKSKLYQMAEENQTELIYRTKFYNSVKAD